MHDLLEILVFLSDLFLWPFTDWSKSDKKWVKVCIAIGVVMSVVMLVILFGSMYY